MLDARRLTQYFLTFASCLECDLRIRLQSAFHALQDMPRYPLKYDQVPSLFAEPFIFRGFRSLDQPWSYYWKSLFHKHNESINVWSHLIGILYMVYMVISYNKQIDFLANAHSWPFLVSLCSSILMFACSASAHLLHSKSVSVHMTCFLVDYIGVSVQGFGAGFLQIYYSAPQAFYRAVEYPYVFILLFLGISACTMNCFAQYYYRRPYPASKRFCQFFPCGLQWLCSIAPLCCRMYTWDVFSNPALLCHLTQIVLLLVGATFFAFDMPQCFWPGAFDFIGQGHQIFHLCIFLITVCQMHAVYWDYEEFREHIIQRSKPDLIFCAGSIVFLIICNIVIVYCFRRQIQNKCHHE